MALRLQFVSGLEVLADWAEAASQAERNVVYEALFSIVDGSAFVIYDIFAGGNGLNNFVVVVKKNLVVQFGMRRGEGSFELIHVGGAEDEAIASSWKDCDEA
jgi:hypothetical protein